MRLQNANLDKWRNSNENMFNIHTTSRDLDLSLCKPSSSPGHPGLQDVQAMTHRPLEPSNHLQGSALPCDSRGNPPTSIHAASPLCPDNLPRQLHYSFTGKRLSLPAETAPELQGKSQNQTDVLFNNTVTRTDYVSTTHSFLILTPASWYKTKRVSKTTIGGLINYDVSVLNTKHIIILNGRGCFSCSWTRIVFLQAAKRFLMSASAFQVL